MNTKERPREVKRERERAPKKRRDFSPTHAFGGPFKGKSLGAKQQQQTTIEKRKLGGHKSRGVYRLVGFSVSARSAVNQAP